MSKMLNDAKNVPFFEKSSRSTLKHYKSTRFCWGAVCKELVWKEKIVIIKLDILTTVGPFQGAPPTTTIIREGEHKVTPQEVEVVQHGKEVRKICLYNQLSPPHLRQVYPSLKSLFIKQRLSVRENLAGRLKFFQENWQLIRSDLAILEIVRGWR